MSANFLDETMPLGLSMALAQNSLALYKFSNLTEKERQELVSRSHGVKSSEDMRLLVDGIAEGRI